MVQPVLSIVMPFDGRDDLRLALAAVTVIDMQQIEKHRLPKLYKSGVRYRREFCLAPEVRETCERFLTALQLLKERFGDCDDLAPYRAAELILGGDIRARAIPVRSEVGWHCVVRRGDGSIEDPSAKLGMRVPNA
jgi:hypothetical protein